MRACVAGLGGSTAQMQGAGGTDVCGVSGEARQVTTAVEPGGGAKQSRRRAWPCARSAHESPPAADVQLHTSARPLTLRQHRPATEPAATLPPDCTAAELLALPLPHSAASFRSDAAMDRALDDVISDRQVRRAACYAHHSCDANMLPAERRRRHTRTQRPPH